MEKHVFALAIFFPVLLIFSADFIVSLSGVIYIFSLLYVSSRTIFGRKAVRKYYGEILKMEQSIMKNEL